jgi:hypothetical protein
MNALSIRIRDRIPFDNTTWITIAVTLALIIPFSLSFIEHEWLIHPGLLFIFPVYGWLFGALLSRTRWNGFWCFLFNFIFLLAIASQGIDDIVPSIKDISFTDWLVQLNWQFSLYLDRINGWIVQIIMSEKVSDPSFYSLLLMMELWLPASWYAWSLLRKSKLWLAVLPMLILMIQNIYNTGVSVFLLYTALFVVLVYAALDEYRSKHRQWNGQHMDYPDALWQDWLIAVLLMSMIALIFAHYAPDIATPEGWQHIREWVDEVRESSDEEGIVPKPGEGSTSGSVYQPSNVVHIVSGPDVSRVGAPIPEQNQLAMWVRVADPTPRPWRTAVFTAYTGSGWIEALYGEPIPSPSDEELQNRLGFKYLTQTFSLNGDYDNQLFAAADPVQVNKDQVHMLQVFPDGSVILRGNVTRYEVVSLVPNVGEDHLRSSSGLIPQWIADTYLQLPDTLPQRVRDLSHELVEDQDTQLDQVITIQNYLRESVPYDIDSPMPAEGQDVVDYFLFEAPSGFCTYYASSMVVMLRELGIPARLVTGYASGRYILEQGVFQVWGNQVHAWVEVYFPQYGWIPFEPTPSQEVPGYARSISHINIPMVMSQQTARSNLFWLRVGFGLLVLFVLVLIVKLVAQGWRRSRMISRQAKHPYMRLYFRLRYRLEMFGFPIQANQTAWEFWQQSEAALSAYPRIYDALYLATQGLEKTLYAPGGVGRGELKLLKAAMQSTWKEWVKMSWQKMIADVIAMSLSIHKRMMIKV